MHLPLDSEIPLLGIYCEDVFLHVCMCLHNISCYLQQRRAHGNAFSLSAKS